MAPMLYRKKLKELYDQPRAEAHGSFSDDKIAQMVQKSLNRKKGALTL
jgi:hypothetical protein